MKSLRSFLCVALSLPILAALAPPSAVAGDVTTHEAAGIQFEVPKGWKGEADGDAFHISSADGAVGISFIVTEANSLEAAVNALTGELDKIVSKVKVDGEGKEDTLNGMPDYSLSGTGIIEGAKVEWNVDILVAKKPVILLVVIEDGAGDKHQKALVGFVKSLQKM